jgi:3-hydroxymyristoyl/3-hydroxydecanoyl-(acyl carrier protein) dehydratase
VPVILQIPQALMHHVVYAGDTLQLQARVIRIRENFGELGGVIYREQQLVGEGQMRFAITEKSNLGLDPGHRDG